MGAAALGAGSLLPFGSAQAAVNLKYGNAGNIDTLSNRFNTKLAEELAARSGGELTMEIFAGTLGGEETLIQGMALGTIDVYNGAYTGTREFDILYSPFMFKDGAHAGRVMQGQIGQQASQVLQDKYQARLLGVGRLGPYVLFVKEPNTRELDQATRRRKTAPRRSKRSSRRSTSGRQRQRRSRSTKSIFASSRASVERPGHRAQTSRWRQVLPRCAKRRCRTSFWPGARQAADLQPSPGDRLSHRTSRPCCRDTFMNWRRPDYYQGGGSSADPERPRHHGRR